MEHVKYEALAEFVGQLFKAAGCTDHEAVLVGESLAEANLLGHDSHGVLRVPIYLKDLESGVVRRNQVPKLISNLGAVRAFDGGPGLGHVAGEKVVESGVAAAQEFGISIVTLRNIGHLGRIGRWAEMAAERGIISIHFVNTSGGRDAGVLLATAFGGSDRRMSINPICIGLPREGEEPIIMDATIAASAGGKIMAAANRGDSVPAGQLIDKDGAPTTNPNDMLDGGAILPFGDHRGYALSFMIDVLAGAVSGGGCSSQSKNPNMNNMTSIFLDPAKIGGSDFEADLTEYASWMKSSPAVDPSRPVLLPGEIEKSVANDRHLNGIPMDSTTLEQLQSVAKDLGVAPLKLN